MNSTKIGTQKLKTDNHNIQFNENASLEGIDVLASSSIEENIEINHSVNEILLSDKFGKEIFQNGSFNDKNKFLPKYDKDLKRFSQHSKLLDLESPVLSKLAKRKSKSASNLSKYGQQTTVQFRSDESFNELLPFPALAGRKNSYNHVKSKVKDYIDSYKKVSLLDEGEIQSTSSKRISSSLTNLNLIQNSSNQSNKLKQSTEYTKFSDENLCEIEKDKISRFLDNLSESENDDFIKRIVDKNKISNIEDILTLAINERRKRKEIKSVLCQLQTNYDFLQRKFAEAENKIDNLRFKKIPKDNLSQENSMSNKTVDIERNTLPINVIYYIQNLMVQILTSNNTITMKDILEIKKKLNALGIQKNNNPASSFLSKEIIKELNDILDNFIQIYDLDFDGIINDEDLINLCKNLCSKIENRKLNSFPDLTDKHISTLNFFEKVSKWKMCINKDPKTNGISSCYNSLATSPTLSELHYNMEIKNDYAEKASQESIKASYETSDVHSVSPLGDFDSGYPASDKSIKLHRGLKNFGRNSLKKKSTLRESFNYKEEKKDVNKFNSPNICKGKELNGSSNFHTLSLTDSQIIHSFDNDSEIVNFNKQSLLNSPTPRRKFLHSITDLSSDEQSIFEENLKISKFENLPSSAISTDRQPIKIAQQIDQEISQLRDFYEFHRKEMMQILKVFPEAKKVNFVSKFNSDNLTDIGKKKKKEYEKRRQKKKFKFSESKKPIDVDINFNKSDLKFNSHLNLKNKEHNSINRNTAESPAISSFFPNFNSYQGITDDKSICVNGRHILTDYGKIFVPRLNLNEIMTNDIYRDSKNFDHNMSSDELEVMSESDKKKIPAIFPKTESNSFQNLKKSGKKRIESVNNQRYVHLKRKTDLELSNKTPSNYKTKAKKDMKTFILALEEVNKIASNLEERSKSILNIFKESSILENNTEDKR